MTDRTLRIDMAIALVVAIVLLVISPGLAITGIVALLAILVSAGSFLVQRRRRRRPAQRRSSRRRSTRTSR